MPGEGADVLADLGIPDSHRVVVTATCQGGAVRTERYACDRIRMPREGAYGCAGLGIPDSHRSILTPTCQGAAIRTVRCA